MLCIPQFLCNGVICDRFVKYFEIVAPVFILAAVGYIWVKFGFEYRVEFVTQFAMAIAAVFGFHSSYENRISAIFWIFCGCSFGYFSLPLAFVFVKIFKLGQRTYLMPLILEIQAIRFTALSFCIWRFRLWLCYNCIFGNKYCCVYNWRLGCCWWRVT